MVGHISFIFLLARTVIALNENDWEFQFDNELPICLKKNEKKYLGKKLTVDFSVQSEANGFTFQVMKNVRIAQ
jgi:hypothetical protein